MKKKIKATAPAPAKRRKTGAAAKAARVFVRTRLRLAGIEREIEMNLSDRCGMRFPLLLGRTALADAFTVDPAGSFLHRRRRGHRPLPPAGDV